MTSVSQKEWHLRCYGISEESLSELKPLVGDSPQDWGMLAMSLLSDAQECLICNRMDLSRQLMNRAKWVISREWMDFKQEDNLCT